MTIDIGMSFLETTPKAQLMKEIIEELDIIKIKNVCSVIHTVSTAAQVLSADRAEGRVKRRLGLPPLREINLHEVRLQTCMNLGVCKPRDLQGRKVGNQPKSSWVTFLRYAYLRMWGLRFARAMPLRPEFGICFKVELQTPGSPRELHKGDNFTSHLQTSCL